MPAADQLHCVGLIAGRRLSIVPRGAGVHLRAAAGATCHIKQQTLVILRNRPLEADSGFAVCSLSTAPDEPLSGGQSHPYRRCPYVARGASTKGGRPGAQHQSRTVWCGTPVQVTRNTRK